MAVDYPTESLRGMSTVGLQTRDAGEPSISDVVDELERVIASMNEAVGMLTNRLAPILKPDSPGPVLAAGDSHDAYTSGFNARLRRLTEDLMGLNKVTNNLTARVDL